MKEPPNQGLDLTIPGAAQSALRPLCLLSGLAAQAHVGHAEQRPATNGILRDLDKLLRVLGDRSGAFRGRTKDAARSQDSSDDAVAEIGYVEVDEQSDGIPAEAQIGEELRRMNRQRLLNGLELDNYRVADEQIHPERGLKRNSLVLDREIDLALEGNATSVQLVTERRLIGRLEQSGTEYTVDFDRGAQNISRQCLFAQHGNSSVTSTNSL